MEGMQKKIAVLNDLSGYGRCSLTAAMPVISALKVQCCPVVTAVLSNHAGYPECYMDDYTDRMEAYLEPWRKMGFEMDGIMTGFLGSARQASIVADFIRDFKRENTQVLVDPTMGDHGHLYSVCDEELIEAMRELMQYADVVTPNLTEACALTDTLYQENGWSKRKLSDLTWKLHLLGARSVILTGVVKGKQILNVIHERGKDPVFHATKFVAGNYHGTGDVFAAVIGASMVRGVPMEESRQTGGSFYKKMCGKDRRTWCPGAGRTVPGGVSVLFDEVELNIMGSLSCFVSRRTEVTVHG